MNLRTVDNEEYLVLFYKGLMMDRLMTFLGLDSPKSVVELIEAMSVGVVEADNAN